MAILPRGLYSLLPASKRVRGVPTTSMDQKDKLPVATYSSCPRALRIHRLHCARTNRADSLMVQQPAIGQRRERLRFDGFSSATASSSGTPASMTALFRVDCRRALSVARK
jgi:hypothetical protein